MSDSTQGENWLKRLSGGLKRTSSSLGGAITDLVSKRKLDAATLEELEDELIRADLGPETAGRIAAALGEGRFDKAIAPDEVRAVLADEIEKVLSPVAKPLEVTTRPFVILVAGVNGSGKTTTIGKLAARFRAEGKTVMLVAGDTFRAAAIDQLKIWGERTGASVMAREPGADAAGLTFDALAAAKTQGVDVVLVDTAGRLQNRAELMGELEKMVRVMRKVEPVAPHAVLLVLDATVGQNALSQVEIFGRIAGVTGLVMTKLDGTARGGILVAIAARFGLPVHFIGVGEGVEDLAPFTARDFARAIVGLDTTASSGAAEGRVSKDEVEKPMAASFEAPQDEDMTSDALHARHPPMTETKPAKKQLNPTLKLVLDIGPLILFFAANAKFGIYAATGAFMVAVLIALTVSYVLTRHIAIMPLVTAAIVLVFGGLTLILHDELFIKLKPTIIYVLFGGALLAGLALGKPLLGLLFDSVFKLTEEGWRKLTWRWALFFLLLAVINEIVWRTQTTDFWVSFKLFGVVPLTFLFAALQYPLLVKYSADKKN